MKKCMMMTGLMAVFGTTAVLASAPFAAAVQSEGHWGAVDGQNKKIIPAIYDNVASSLAAGKNHTGSLNVAEDAQKNEDLGLIEVSYNDLRGFYDREGKAVVPVSYDQRSSWIDGTLMIRSHGKYGYYRSDGTVLAEPVYDSAAVYCEGMAGVGQDGHHGFIDAKGQTAVPFAYTAVGSFQDGLAAVKRDGKWGVIDKSGKEIIPCVYDDMQHQYAEGFIGIKQNGLWGFAGKNGAVTVAPAFKGLIGGFHDGMAAVEMADGYAFIDPSGKVVASQLKNVYTSFNEGLAAVRLRSGERGYIDKRGQLAIRTDYDNLGPFEQGLAEYGRTVVKPETTSVVSIGIGGGGHHHHHGGGIGIGIGIGGWGGYDDDYPYYGGWCGSGISIGTGLSVSRVTKHGYIDRTGRIIVSAQMDGVSSMTSDGAFVKNHGKWGFVRRDGTYLVPAEYKNLDKDDDLALFIAQDNKGQWGTLDSKTGQSLIPFQYAGMKAAGTVLAYKRDSAWGIMKPDGTVLTPPQYDIVGSAAEDRIPVKDDKGWSYLDMTGKPAITAPEGTTQADAFYSGYAPVKVHGKWGVIDLKGNVTVPPVYNKMVVL